MGGRILSYLFLPEKQILKLYDMNYWLHRITGGDNAARLSYPLFKKEEGDIAWISIGWSDFSNEESLRRIQGDESGFDRLFEEAGWGRPKNRFNLRRFVREMKQGDEVIVPLPWTFTICRIVDDAIYTIQDFPKDLLVDCYGNPVTIRDNYLCDKDGNDIDLGFFRKVEILLKDIPRSDYARQDLHSRMKIRQTNALITDLRESIEIAKQQFIEKRPINLKATLQAEMGPVALAKMSELLNADSFENLVRKYLESMGGKLRVPNKNESTSEMGDADVEAYFEKIGVVIMAQVKKHDEKTDSWAVEQIKAYGKNHQYDNWIAILWVVSTCNDYSKEAKELAAKSQDGTVRLITGLEFAKMVLDAGLDIMTE